MRALRLLAYGVFAISALPGLAASAQVSTFRSQSSLIAPAQGSLLGRSYLGINLGRARSTAQCSTPSILCDDDRERPSQLYAGTMIGGFWGAEISYLNTGRVLREGSEGRAQGLNLSLVGRARLGSSL